MLGSFFNGLGIVGSVCFCLYIIKKAKDGENRGMILKKFMITAISIAFLSFCCFILSVRTAKKTFILVSTCLVGFSITPLMFMSFELLVYLTPNIGEAMSCGILNTSINFFSFCIIQASTPFLMH